MKHQRMYVHVIGAFVVRIIPYRINDQSVEFVLPPVFPVCVCPSNVEVDMKKWNSHADVSSIESWLKDEGVYDLAVTVPYRQNRWVGYRLCFLLLQAGTRPF